ncbi:58226813-2244-4017-a310-bd02d15db2c0 [Thermothielavioides terrestris]|uniref:58226813-2244-4017-a310-bd02d15db2c0 n=1 Tax=Thermothielavioides terrestris TaxID=2587410 RepID=A0A3S4AI67_9PEZI|nr:58226813-2244-4017-a310-bd02d15db2c0 [Thermothielavioides terrestris]
MVGKPGFDRAHVDRALPTQDVYQLPPPGGRTVILPDDKIVKPAKWQLTNLSYSDKFPMLQVAPGDFVAILYTENGHVTRADMTNPTKPVNRGTVYLYGTTNNDLSNTNLLDVHLKWTADGKGGDGKGKLLATRHFDDGQCHEAVPVTGDPEGISTYRKQFISKADALICQSDLQIPLDMAVGQTLTVIWVWDWPTMNVQGVAVPPASYQSNSSTAQGNASQPYVAMPELYTGVLDYKIVDPCSESLGEVKGPTCKNRNGKFVVQFASQAATTRGIVEQMLNPFLVKVPQAGFQIASATADPSNNIPLHPLIGVTSSHAFPLPSSVLTPQMDLFQATAMTFTATATAAATTAATTPPSESSSSTPTATSAGTSGQGGDAGGAVAVITVSVTVPVTLVTVTVTAGPAQSSSADAGAGTTETETATFFSSSSSSPLPTVTQFLPNSRLVRVRGGAYR